MTRFLSFVGLILILYCITGCSKAKIGPGYTGKMGGVRLWHRADYNTGGRLDRTDTSFALTIVNDTTIRFLSTEFTYSPLYSSDSVYYFGEGYTALMYRYGEGIAYFPLQDSIVYADAMSNRLGWKSRMYFTD